MATQLYELTRQAINQPVAVQVPLDIKNADDPTMIWVTVGDKPIVRNPAPPKEKYELPVVTQEQMQYLREVRGKAFWHLITPKKKSSSSS